MLDPSTAIRLRKMILLHVPGGRASLESSLGAKPPYAGVTIAILGDHKISSLKFLYARSLDLSTTTVPYYR
eukprot:COSAG05_NODE_1847_length_3968_cov_9.225381_2_plen_71_part_00